MNAANVIFGVGSFLFALALVPSVVRQNAPARSTSLLTAAVLTVFLYPYITLHYWLSTVTDAITAGLWWVLLVQGQPMQEEQQ